MHGHLYTAQHSMPGAPAGNGQLLQFLGSEIRLPVWMVWGALRRPLANVGAHQDHVEPIAGMEEIELADEARVQLQKMLASVMSSLAAPDTL